MKSVEFDVPGEAAHQSREMKKYVLDAARTIYGVEIDLSGVDLQNYYRQDGAKITKSLSSLLRQKISKEEVQSKFATFAKLVSELYTTGLSLKAEFGDKRLVGEGVYEGGKTCFRSDGENATSKHFVVNNRRCAVVVLYQKGKKEAGGRCLAYFAGNRNVYLTNFYWRSIPQNKLYFITALRHLLGIKKVLYRHNPKFFLPIFKNGDSVLVYDERTKPVIPNKKTTCPHCHKTVEESSLYAEEYNSYRLVGCSKECARKHSKAYRKCDECGEYIHAESIQKTDTGSYCNPCYRIRIVNCNLCGSGYPKSAMKEINGQQFCKKCASKSKCIVCGVVVIRSSDVKQVGDGYSCITCLPKSGHLCLVCRTISSKKLPVRKVLGMKIPICDDCAAPLPGTVMEAQGKTLAMAR